MKINLLFIIVLLVFAASVLIGSRKGLLKSALSLGSFIVIIVLVGILNPMVCNVLKNHTSLPEKIEEKVVGMIIPEEIKEQAGEQAQADEMKQLLQKENLGAADQAKLIERLPFPEKMKLLMQENNNSVIYDRFGVDNFVDYISIYTSNLIINLIGLIATLILAFVIVHMLMFIFGVVDKLPVLGGLNHLAGAVLGAVIGLLVIEVGFLLISAAGSSGLGADLLRQIEENRILQLMYDQNIFIRLFLSWAGKGV